MPIGLALVSLAWLSWGAAIAGEEKKDDPKGKTVLEKRVERALDRAFDYLRKSQNQRGKGKEGAWSFREPYWESGVTSLALFTMLRAGMDRDDPMIRAGFQYLVKNVDPEGPRSQQYTYNLTTQMLAIAEGFGDMLESKKPGNAAEQKLLAIFEAGFTYCKKALKEGEAGYTIEQEGIDLSNTQFIVMALEAAHRVGYTIPSATWFEILDKGMELQAEDGPKVNRVNILSRKADEVDKYGYVIKDRYGWIPGKPAKARGWSYGEFFKKDEIYGSMTCAGLANLLSCYFVLQEDVTFKKTRERKLQDAVRDGFAWLQKYYAVNENPAEPRFWSMGRRYEGDTFWTYYYIFTLARITTATNIRFIGNRNWYTEGADFLLKAQRPDGSWDQTAHETHNFKSDCIPFVNTAFALWFFSSLEHGKPATGIDMAAAVRKDGTPPGPGFEANVLRLLEDVYSPKERWDVERLVDGTADLLLALATHPAWTDWSDRKETKDAALYVRSSVIATAHEMERALKAVKEPDPMSENYARQQLYERWRTGTLCRQLLAEVALAMAEKDWDALAQAKPGKSPAVASRAKKRVSLIVKQLLSHAIKVGRDGFGWADSCGKPAVLKPDAGNTADVLDAFHVASLCGVKKPSSLWKAAAKFLISTQEKEGEEVDLLGPDGKSAEKKARARGFGVLPGDPAEDHA